MDKVQFLEEKLQKAGGSLKAIASLITQSFELEAMTEKSPSDVGAYLAGHGKGVASRKGLSDGNGWNGDSHADGSLNYYNHVGNKTVYGTETSSSPLHSIQYSDVREEVKEMIQTYSDCAGKIYHTDRGSTHVHNTLAYASVPRQYNWEVFHAPIKFNKKLACVNLCFLFLKFMPAMKWLSMTCADGARGLNNNYDRLYRDELFNWYERTGANLVYAPGEDGISCNTYDMCFDRQSYFRLLNAGNDNIFHFENRMCDTTFSPTHLAMWLTINRAITLLAIDFARRGLLMSITDEEVMTSKHLMESFSHTNGIFREREAVKLNYKEFVSYLSKYLKVLNSLEVIDVMDKMIQKSIPEYLQEKGIRGFYEPKEVEKLFATRDRQSDTNLREAFIRKIDSMAVPSADSLNAFHDNMAVALGVEVKKVKSLYQMFKRENVDIEFLGGRLVYMGD